MLRRFTDRPEGNQDAVSSANFSSRTRSIGARVPRLHNHAWVRHGMCSNQKTSCRTHARQGSRECDRRVNASGMRRGQRVAPPPATFRARFLVDTSDITSVPFSFFSGAAPGTFDTQFASNTAAVSRNVLLNRNAASETMGCSSPGGGGVDTRFNPIR
jgi:hypothetical protein